MDLHEIEVEPTYLVGGIWWDFQTKLPCQPRTAAHATHFCVLVVPFGIEFERAVAELRMPHLVEARANKGRLPPEVDRTIAGTALARTVLRGWANAEMGGKPLPYSEEQAIALLTDPRWDLLRKFVESAASNESALLAREESDASGN